VKTFTRLFRKWILSFLFICFIASIHAAPGILLTKDYGGQPEGLWKPIPFQRLEESVASVRVFFANGKDIAMPKSQIGKVILVPDLKTLSLTSESELKGTKATISELDGVAKSLPQVVGLLSPVIDYLRNAVGDYENGYVYEHGSKRQRPSKKQELKHPQQSIEVAGTIYSGIEVTKVTNDSITVMHSKGITALLLSAIDATVLEGLKVSWPKPFSDFNDLQRQEALRATVRNMEPQNGSEVTVVTSQNPNNGEDIARLQQRATEEYNAKMADLVAKRVAVAFEISQAGPRGALCYGRRVGQNENGGGWVGLNRAPKIVVSKEHDEPIFVVGLPDDTVDGERMMGWLYPCGIHRYTTVLGASKTVRKYAASVEEAARVLQIVK